MRILEAMMAVPFKTLLILCMLLSSLSAKTKPIKGKVISDSKVYLSNVQVVSLPSSTTTTSDENGVFSFVIPIKDRKISFALSGYHPVTLNVIPFNNDTEVELIEVIEVDYLDSINTSIKFVLSREGENILSYDMDDLSRRGLNRIESILLWNNSILIDQRMDGESTFMIDGTPDEEIDILYSNIKINNIGDPLMALTPISEKGLSELIITDGGYSKFSASSQSIHFLPNIRYDNKLELNRYQNSQDDIGLDGFGSIGIKYATINGGISQREYRSFFSDSAKTEIMTKTNNYFSNIGMTNRKNIEATFMGLQNTADKFNYKSQDSSSIEENSFIAKIDQWSPLTGRINIYGFYQDRVGFNHNQLDSLDLYDKCSSLGFSVEKDLTNYLLTFSTSSKLINSNWVLNSGNALIERQNSILTGSIELFLDQKSKNAYFKDIKLVFSKERTTDVKDPTSEIDILPNYWDEHGFQLSTTIVDQKDNGQNSVYVAFGESSNVPYLEDVIKGSIYSFLRNEENDIMPENRSSFDMAFSHNNKFEKYEWSYLIKMNLFSHQYENKIQQIPLVGNSMNLPFNVGRAGRSGIGIHLELQPYVQRFRFSSTIAAYGGSDNLKFQLLPSGMIKNQIFIHNKFFDLNFLAVTKGKRNMTFIDGSNQLQDQQLQRTTSYGFQISKAISYKILNAIISLTGENLYDDKILIDEILIDERKIAFEVDILIQ